MYMLDEDNQHRTLADNIDDKINRVENWDIIEQKNIKKISAYFHK